MQHSLTLAAQICLWVLRQLAPLRIQSLQLRLVRQADGCDVHAVLDDVTPPFDLDEPSIDCLWRLWPQLTHCDSQDLAWRGVVGAGAAAHGG